jgi:hypothetical protein
LNHKYLYEGYGGSGEKLLGKAAGRSINCRKFENTRKLILEEASAFAIKRSAASMNLQLRQAGLVRGPEALTVAGDGRNRHGRSDA